MKRRSTVLAMMLLGLAGNGSVHADDFLDQSTSWLDQVDNSMRVSFFKGAIVAQLSGLLDFEGYYIEQPTIGTYTTNNNELFAPRLTLNFDAQITPAVYAFAELRVDRGFDPADQNLEARFDSYGISWKPYSKLPVEIQAGKFASVVGTYSEQYDSWSNPFIDAPLPYENLTPVWDHFAPASTEQFHAWRNMTNNADLALPIMWGPAYGSGFATFADLGQFSFAAEMKNASISSRPEYWDFDSRFLSHPTWSSHISWQPSPTWRFGVSGSIGPYLDPSVAVAMAAPDEYALPPGKTIDDYLEETIGEDVTFAWRHWQIWAEFFETRFQVPRVGNADTFAWYIEVKYKFTPQLFAAIRFNQQLYSEVPVAPGVEDQWGNDINRIDVAITYRWTERLQTKLQYSFTDDNLPERHQQHMVAGQVTVRY
jgi:hypothetical protein